MVHDILRHAQWFTSPSNLMSLFSFIVALASAIYARNSAVSSRRSYELAALQDSRRLPKLSLYLSDCYSHAFEGRFALIASITVSNPTDIDNSIVRAELVIVYHKQKGQSVRISVASTSVVPEFISGVANLLDPPVPVPSHQSVAGLLLFEQPAVVLDGSVIDGYSLSISDSHGEVSDIESLTVRQIFSSQE